MIHLYTAPTPNGRKVSIALEETGLPYTVHSLRLDRGEQQAADFLAISPNGRIPAITDADADDLAVFESGAILIYLAEKTGRFLPSAEPGRSRVLQWLMFQMGGVGPMQGQAAVFLRYAPERLPYAIRRYQTEVRRLYEVLNTQLTRNEYLAGEYSIADMATYPWVVTHPWVEVPIDDLPALERWLRVVGERAAVTRGMDVPVPWSTDVDVDKLVARARATLV